MTANTANPSAFPLYSVRAEARVRDGKLLRIVATGKKANGCDRNALVTASIFVDADGEFDSIAVRSGTSTARVLTPAEFADYYPALVSAASDVLEEALA